MVGLRRLVGWWLAAGLTLPCATRAHAQSTASFPEDPPARPSAAPPARPAPAPARPAPAPVRPAPARPTPAPAPVRSAAPVPAAPPARPPVTIPITPERNLEPSPYRSAPSPTVVFHDRRQGPADGLDGPRSLDFAPPILPYRKGMPVPAGYEVVTRANSGLITGGVVGMAASYGVALIVGASQGFENGTGWLAAPLVGPWGAIGARTYECKSATQTVAEAKKCVRNAVGEVQVITVIAVDGIAQLATTFVMLAGALSSHQELVRKDLLNVSFVPAGHGRDAWQLSVSGQF